MRVQRLTAIDLQDARAEGCEIPELAVLALDETERDQLGRTYYRAIWETIHGKGSWNQNPWVTAYTFSVERRNIDDAGQEAP
ncbi:hypothetical protein F4V89_12855 [Neorhizobium galegae]|nr:hypothetical protein F4V89_12855 [Neorhizobium galegae]